jgi:uncharacterized membrane protein
MQTASWLKAAGAGALVLGVLDALWLNGPGGALYKSSIGELLRRSPDGSLMPMWVPVSLVYALLLLGLLVLVVPRAGGQVLTGAALGALFGLVVYGVYDCTNLGLLRGWTLKVAVVDICWGTVLGAVTGAAMTWASRP